VPALFYPKITLRSSPALAARLQAAEHELARREATLARPSASVEQLLPRMEAEYREMIAGLEQTLSLSAEGQFDPRLVARSRAALPRRYGEIRVEVTEDAIEFRSTRGVEAALARAAGGDQQILMVAGGGFVRSHQASLRAAA